MILSSLADLANLLGSMNWYASAILASLLRPAPPQPGPFHSWSGEGSPGASEYSSRTEDLFAPLEWEPFQPFMRNFVQRLRKSSYSLHIGIQPPSTVFACRWLSLRYCKETFWCWAKFCFCFQESPMLVCTAQQNARTLPLSWWVAEGFFVFWDSFQPVLY